MFGLTEADSERRALTGWARSQHGSTGQLETIWSEENFLLHRRVCAGWGSYPDPVFEMRSDPDPVFKIWSDSGLVF